MRTKIQISPKRYFQYVKDSLVWKKDYIFRKGKRYQDFLRRMKNKQTGPLNPDEIKVLAEFQVSKVTLETSKEYARKAFVKDTDLDKSMHEVQMQVKAAKLLLRTLESFLKDTKIVTNIGARVDTVSSFAARRYPNVKFISVDLQSNLSEVNAVMPQSPNWTFMSGYALDLLIQGDLSADLFFMTSTSVLFNNVELDAYLREMSKSAKFIVLNEPWWPRNDSVNIFTITRPEEVPINDPYCGGFYSDYHHNYIKKLVKLGYQIVSSDIVYGYERWGALQIVASRL